MRVNEHRLVYSPGLKVHHLALLLAMLLSEQVAQSDVYIELVESGTALGRRARRLLDELSTGK